MQTYLIFAHPRDTQKSPFITESKLNSLLFYLLSFLCTSHFFDIIVLFCLAFESHRFFYFLCFTFLSSSKFLNKFDPLFCVQSHALFICKFIYHVLCLFVCLLLYLISNYFFNTKQKVMNEID